jgi:hypothetical protein
VRRPRQAARMPAGPTRQCDGLVAEPGIPPGLTARLTFRTSADAFGPNLPGE